MGRISLKEISTRAPKDLDKLETKKKRRNYYRNSMICKTCFMLNPSMRCSSYFREWMQAGKTE